MIVVEKGAETRRVLYRDTSGATHEAKWPKELKPTSTAIFRGVTYRLAGVSDNVIYYSQALQ